VRYLLAAIVVLPVLALAVGALTGRVRARSCCSIADPAKDLRMRVDEPPVPPAAGSGRPADGG